MHPARHGPERARARERELERLAVGVLWTLWCWRVELALVAVLVVAQRVIAALGGDPVGAVVVAVIAIAVLAVPAGQRKVRARLQSARARRRWARAEVESGAARGPFRVSRVLGVTFVASGIQLRLRVARGRSVTELDAHHERLAACLRVRDVRVTRAAGDAGEAAVLLVRRDPFEGAAPLPWPNRHAQRLSLWDPIPVGVDEQGDTVWLELAERNMLIGGEPGAGKSAALSMLVATGALDADACVWLLDGKLVELAVWAPAARRIAGPDLHEALDVLRMVRAEMDSRYRELLARGLRKVRREDGLPLHLVVCDELAFFLTAPDKAQRQEFAELLRDLVARGRAAGVIVCAATQKPGADVVPSALRDLFGFRLALRCTTPQASDTILGQGWASAGADASSISGAQRGVGLLLAEGDRPTRMKTFYLCDDDVLAIAERGGVRRAEVWFTSALPNDGTSVDQERRP